ncbi:MAG: hypothetical protein ACP5K1_00415 [Candidatus Bathyarchaeia archaeon]
MRREERREPSARKPGCLAAPNPVSRVLDPVYKAPSRFDNARKLEEA